MQLSGNEARINDFQESTAGRSDESQPENELMISSISTQTNESSLFQRYSIGNLVTLAIFVIILLAFLIVSILALAWSKKPFLGFVVEPTLVVSNVGGVSWNAQRIGLDYPERIRQIGERNVSSAQDFETITTNLPIGSPVVIGTIFPDGELRVYPSVRVTPFPSVDLLRFFWLPFIIGLAYLGIGFWTYRMRSDIAPSHAFAFFCISAALATGLYFDLISTHALSALWTVGISFLGGTLIVLALVFPHEWSESKQYVLLRYLPYGVSLGLAVWGVLALADQSDPWAYVNPWRFSYIYTSLGIFFFLGMMFYRQFTNPLPATRQQARIVLWGSLFSFLPIALWMLAPYLGLQIPWNPSWFLPFLLLFPIAIAIAILRYRLWDIDIIINRTLVYGLLIIVLVLLYFASVLFLQRTFEAFTGESSDLAAVISTLVIVALFIPIRNYVQDFVDRRFYRSKYDANRIIESFGESLRDEVDLDRVMSRLEGVVQETIQPDNIYSWLTFGADFRIFRPDETAPFAGEESQQEQFTIAIDDPILEYLKTAPDTIDLDKLTVDTQSRGIMLSAGINEVIPLITRGELIGWMGLGHRLSGQDYSANDKLMLSRLAIQVAPTLRVAQLVAEQQAEAVERERLEQEMLVARRIQSALLPKELPSYQDWYISAFYQPARQVGGDFYEYKYFEDGRLGIFIGDVTDKGIPAAMVMATTRTLLMALADESLSPGEVLKRVNNLLQKDIPASMFVTCFYAILDPLTGRMVFSNAGHNLPYHQTRDGILELKAAGMPLGLMPDREYDLHETIVEPGDRLILYSDGLIEAHNSQGEMFGYNRLINLISNYEGDDPRLIDHLTGELMAFTGTESEQEDDITIVTIKRYNSSQDREGK